jgi:selenocysteine-specific elongation factor
VNLQGVEKAMIRRGNTLATKDSLRPTYMVDALLHLLPSAPRKLKNRAKVRFHSGTSEIISTVILLDRDELGQGETCFVQMRLDEPTTVLKADCYVLRSYSPVRTIGGGEILNALPKKRKRFSEPTLTDMRLLHKGELKEIIEIFVSSARLKGLEESELSFLTNTGKKKLDEELKGLKAQKRIIQYDKEHGVLIHSDFLKKARDEIINTITHYHKNFPLKVGLLKEELRSRTTGSSNPKLFNYLINQLTREGTVIQEKDVLRLKDHRVTLAQDQEKMRRELEEIYLKDGLHPPYFKELREKFPGNTAAEVLEVMLKDGILLKTKEDLYFHRKAIEELEDRLVNFLKKHGEVTTPQFKDMTGVSRKYAIPLAEYFDKAQVTVRVGDSRLLRKE